MSVDQAVKPTNESFGSWMKKGLAGAALTGALSIPIMGAGNTTAPKPMVQPAPIQRPIQPVAPPKQPDPVVEPVEEPAAPDTSINIDIISQLESGGNAKAKSGRGARGLCQLKKAAWDEAVKSLYGKKGVQKYPYYTSVNRAEINKIVADHYYNIVIPKHLESFDLPITKESILAAYNWGSTNVKRAMARYGDNWLSHAPAETRSYVERYLNIENS